MFTFVIPDLTRDPESRARRCLALGSGVRRDDGGWDRVLATYVIPDLFPDPRCLDVDAARVEGWMPELVRHDG